MKETTHTPTFLQEVAGDILRKHGNDLSRVTVVFPNKRASLFLNEALVAQSDAPVWSPRYRTISQLFQSQSERMVADDIKLVCDLYRSYVACTGSTETLDKFYGWGEVLLGDFDDIDKSLADTQRLFSNLSDIHAFDSSDYLSDRQVAVLKQFFKDFDDDHNSQLRAKFLKLWSRLGAIYDDFNQRLAAQGITYEGALYREACQRQSLLLDSEKYIFVGFNALQKAEIQLFRTIRRERQAYFYWDYDRYYTDSKDSRGEEAGNFIRPMLSLFPNELSDASTFDHLSQPKSITYIGSPTDDMQARYAHTWLSAPSRAAAGNKTAIVMCDEQLLPTLLHSIPHDISQLNVTTGFPLSQSTVASFVRRMLEMAHFGLSGHDTYRLKYVAPVLRHPYCRLLSPLAMTLHDDLNANHRNFPHRDELSLDDGLALLFTDLTDLRPTDGDTPLTRNQATGRWLTSILRRIATSAERGDDPLFEESLFRMYTMVNRLNLLCDSGDLAVDFITWQRLLSQLIDATKVPFHGEPARGLQVMGVLETRNLDFDHLLLLSCNDGNMPRGADDPSFIPHSLREAFGLTTGDHKVSIYAYYYYRLMQRAGDITIMYRNTADIKQTGEMSRFMLQMMVESTHAIERRSLVSRQSPTIHEHPSVEKTTEVMGRIRQLRYLSPTAINHYIKCPLLFYYNHVAGLLEPDNDSDEVDNRTFGLIFHDAVQSIYDRLTGIRRDDTYRETFRGGFKVERRHIEALLRDPSIVERAVDESFKKEFFKDTRQSSHLQYNGLQLINRKVIVHYVRQLLNIDLQLTPFVIRGHEGDVRASFTVTTSDGDHIVAIGGRIDRLDEVLSDDGTRCIRVIDYKTGSRKPGAMNSIDDIFSSDNIDKHSDYYLQSMLYSLIVSHDANVNPQGLPVAPALLFIQKSAKEGYDPTLKIGKKKISDIRDYGNDFEDHLKTVVGQIMEPSLPFKATDDKTLCLKCVYRNLCGRRIFQDYAQETTTDYNNKS